LLNIVSEAAAGLHEAAAAAATRRNRETQIPASRQTLPGELAVPHTNLPRRKMAGVILAWPCQVANAVSGVAENLDAGGCDRANMVEAS
jgi:hypothetical protein